MDATEAQLRFGASLTDSTDSAHPLHPSNSTPATTSPSSEYHDQVSITFEFLIFVFSSFIHKTNLRNLKMNFFVNVCSNLTQTFALIL